MNTSTRANFANADQCHASTANTPLLRSYGLVLPQVTSRPSTSQWERYPNLHCQAIANEYQWALDNEDARLAFTAQLHTDACNWLQSEISKIMCLGFLPVFNNAENSLTETIKAFNQYNPGNLSTYISIPISNHHNDPHSVWSPLENLLFRFVHDYHHWLIGADATFNGELAVTRHILTPTLRHNDALARFLASEIIGQAATTITTGAYPVQIIARNILTLI